MTEEERKVKRRAYLAEYRARNRDKIAAQQKRWAEANPERARAIKKRWADANRDAVKRMNQEYYRANPDRHKQNSRRWRAENPEKWALILKANKHKREARKRGLPSFHVAEKDLRRLLSSPCAVPGCQRQDIQIDHIVPIARGGSHGIGNLQPLCGSHNAAKNARLWIEFRAYLQRSSCEKRTA